MKNSDYVVIMAGGIGSRFWPVSRNYFPKQFLDILGIGKTLIQQTFARFEKLVPKENVFVITSDEYLDIVYDQLPMLPKQNILGEPCRKNTAPCIAYLAIKLKKLDPDAVLIVTPADHLILDEPVFVDVCRTALKFAALNPALLTLGITPSYPNTGYGYIQRKATEVSPAIYQVNKFTEKPDIQKAISFIEHGDYFWNAGIFVWQASVVVQAYQNFLPGIYEAFMGCWDHYNTVTEVEKIRQVFNRCESVSVDVGILEKADNVFILPAVFGWSDLGTWTSAWENMDKDDMQNAISGDRVLVVDSSNCIVHAPNNKSVVLQGLDNFIIVDTSDALLICSKDKEQSIKQYVDMVKMN